MSKHDIIDVLTAVGKKCKISGKEIEVKRNSVGIAILGKLDFLVNYCGYRVRFV